MGKDIQNVPKLRFKGYEDAWEQHSWKDCVDVSTNMVDPTNGEFDDLPHIGPGNIESFTGQLMDNIHTVAEDCLISGKFLFHSGDIIYGKINPHLGKYSLVDFDGLASADAYVLNAKNNLNQAFLYVILHTKNFYQYSVSVSKRSGIPKINRDQLNEYQFNAPSTREQEKIGALIVKIDSLVSLHQRKLSKLQDLKKAILVKMFPAEGESVPAVRFNGFTDAWEQRKLGDFAAKVITKNTDFLLTETLTNSAEDGILSQTDYFDREIANNKNIDGYYIVEPDDFVYNPRVSTKAPVGPINRNCLGRAGIMSPLYTVFRTDDTVDSLFLEFYFKTSYWHPFMRYNGDTGARSDRFSIKNDLFFSMGICLPSLEEQERIGKLLDQVDILITLHQRKLSKLKDIKKALLNNMFPGGDI